MLDKKIGRLVCVVSTTRIPYMRPTCLLLHVCVAAAASGYSLTDEHADHVQHAIKLDSESNILGAIASFRAAAKLPLSKRLSNKRVLSNAFFFV